jgi:hypothetical protein
LLRTVQRCQHGRIASCGVARVLAQHERIAHISAGCDCGSQRARQHSRVRDAQVQALPGQRVRRVRRIARQRQTGRGI